MQAGDDTVVTVPKEGGDDEEEGDEYHLYQGRWTQVSDGVGSVFGSHLRHLRVAAEDPLARWADELEDGSPPFDQMQALARCALRDCPDGCVFVRARWLIERVTNDDGSNGGWVIAGLCARMAFVERPAGVDDVLLARAKAYNDLASKVASELLDVLVSPEYLENACAMAVYAFRKDRDQYLACRTCCPTAEDRARAKRELFDPKLATRHSTVCGEQGDDADRDPLAADRSKIVHVDVHLADFIPSRFRGMDGAWLDSEALSEECLAEMVRPPAGIGGPGQRWHPEALKKMGIQTASQLAVCTGNSATVTRMLDGMTATEMLMTVHMHVDPAAILGEAAEPLGDFQFISACHAPFRKPQCVIEEFHSEADGDGEGAKTGGTIKQPTCAGCSRTRAWGEDVFRACGGCKSALYCSRDCQRDHWKREHRAHCAGRRRK